MVNYKFYYFDGRGIGEPIRMVFNYGKIPFEDVRYTMETWAANKDKFEFGKVPVLEADGKQLSQSYAIIRYLARKVGLVGKDDWEEAQVDAIGDYQKDVYAELAPYIYTKAGYREGDINALRKDVFLPGVEKHFPNFVKILTQSGSGFLTKGGVTWVDFVVANYLLTIKNTEPNLMEKYPELVQFIDRVHAVPQIKDYVEKRPHFSL